MLELVDKDFKGAMITPWGKGKHSWNETEKQELKKKKRTKKNYIRILELKSSISEIDSMDELNAKGDERQKSQWT